MNTNVKEVNKFKNHDIKAHIFKKRMLMIEERERENVYVWEKKIDLRSSVISSSNGTNTSTSFLKTWL